MCAFGVIGMTVFVVVTGANLSAQNKDEKDTKLKGKLPPFWSKLGLSDEQKQQVYRIKLDFKTKIDSLEAQVKQLKKDEHTKLNDVLTEGQRTKLLKILQESAGAKDDKDKDKGKDKDKDSK
jgi:hypothetical protein